jgi:hypothetical protein
MKIITAYPVIENGKVISNNFTTNTMNYASAEGDKKIDYNALLQKGVELIGSGKISGAIQALKGRKPTKPTTKPAPMPPPPPPPTGLSMGAKIGIAVGGVAVLGAIIYLATKKK